MRILWIVIALTTACCSGESTLKWYVNCGGCGAPAMPPDGGWGPGTCTTQQVGADCDHNGDTCSTTTDPCQPVIICTANNPQTDGTCSGVIP